MELTVKRSKRIFRIGALGLALLVALWLIGSAILVWLSGRGLEGRLAAIRNAGEPVTLADMERPTPAPDQNAAVVLEKARDDIDALTKQLNQIDARFPEQDTVAKLKAIGAALEAYPRVLPLLEQAAACPDYNPGLPYAAGPQPLMSSLLTEAQQFRPYANILRAHASSLRAQGKRDEALRCCLVSFRLSRHLEREPMLMSYLCVLNCRSVALEDINAILRAGPVSGTIRAELDKELAIADDVRGYLQAVKGERAYGISSFKTLTPFTWLNRVNFGDDACCLIDQINEQIELVAQPYAAVAASQAKLKQQGAASLHPLAAQAFPAFIKIRQAMDRVRAQIRCLRILNALQQHGPWQGQEPNLSGLGLPADVITDPYDGSAIKLKQVNGDWLIYCVGPDLKDDGGKLAGNVDVGLGPLPVDPH
jgi:hypothetical protein